MTAPHSPLTKFRPLADRKHPGLAALIGGLTGGIGLAIYFKSLRELFPVEVAGGLVIVVSLVAGLEPLRLWAFLGPLAGGLYGFFRARSSNRRRTTPATPRTIGGPTTEIPSTGGRA